jgi:hypothetical protein
VQHKSHREYGPSNHTNPGAASILSYVMHARLIMAAFVSVEYMYSAYFLSQNFSLDSIDVNFLGMQLLNHISINPLAFL